MNPRDTLARALAHHQGGRLTQAEALYHEVLRAVPEHPDALRLLGVLAAQSGRHDAAVGLIERAIAQAPDVAEYRASLGSSLRALGRLDEAAAALKAALALRDDLAEAHNTLGMVRREQGLARDAEAAFRRTLTFAPNAAEVHNNLGNALRDQGRVGEAVACYDRALALRPDYADASFNRAEALRRVIPGWHFVMLADDARNAAFEEAITRAVTPDAHVLDIGTGSGLLAMMAARAGARLVTACEADPHLAAAATEIVARNGFSARVKVVPKRSTQLRVGVDLASLADVIVAEVLDVGLIGEGVLPTLRHALAALAKPGARVIPRGATVQAALVTLPALRRVHPIGQVRGFDLSPFDRFRNPTSALAVALEAEPHTLLSEPAAAMSFDFTVAAPRGRQATLSVTPTVDGDAHGVAFWFDLHVDDRVTVSSGPGGALRHWLQAVIFFERDLPVRAGEAVKLAVEHSDAALSFRPLGA